MEFLFRRNFRIPNPLMLHLGCGKVLFDDWVNIDILKQKTEKCYLRRDLRRKLPFDQNSVEFVFNEHFIEHLSLREGFTFLVEIYRVLKPGGVLRIATPDLQYILEKYHSQDWMNQDWIIEFNCKFSSKTEMLNTCFHSWGHRYLYDQNEVFRILNEVGFSSVKRVEFHNSEYSALRSLETRRDSKLIVEATK